MQYLKELSNGNRVRVSQETYNIDRHHEDFQHIICTGSLRVYSIHSEDVTTLPAKALKFGGRGRGGHGAVWGGA